MCHVWVFGGMPLMPQRAAGERRRVQRDDAHDLAEADRRDRQVDAAQPQHRQPEQEPQCAPSAAPASRLRAETASPARSAQQRRGVRADAHERGVGRDQLPARQAYVDRQRQERIDAEEVDQVGVGGEEIRASALRQASRAARVRPAMPMGRISRIRKSAANAIASRYELWPVSATLSTSTRPSRNPPRTAPGMLPMPPTMMTASPRSSMERPMSGEIELNARPYSTPAAPPSAEAMAKVRTIVRSTLMPSTRAARSFSATARIAAPRRVRRTMSCKQRHQHERDGQDQRAATAEMLAPNTLQRLIRRSVPIGKRWVRASNRHSAKASNMVATAIDEIRPERWVSGRRRSGAKAMRSSSTPSSAQTSHRAQQGEARRPAVQLGHQHQRGERAEHEDRRVRQVEDVEDAEDQRVAEREQRVDAAQEQAVDELLRPRRPWLASAGTASGRRPRTGRP